MPQGRAELHEHFGHDGAAWALLAERGWTHERFIMKEPPGKEWADIPQDERDAVEYLVTEWDWG